MVLVQDSFLRLMDMWAMSRVNKFYNRVVPEISRLMLLDWRPLLERQLKYENQVAIDTNRVDTATSFALRSGLDPGRVASILGTEYIGAWKDVDTILHEIESVFRLEDYQHVKIILTKGCPSKLMFDEPKENNLEMIKRGN